MQTSVFSHIYRMNANSLTVQVGSTFYDFGGTTNYVTGVFYHRNYSQFSNMDYDVAVLRVCTD